MSILDERLAEIDRRLRSIQSGLEPAPPDAAEPPPLRSVPEPALTSEASVAEPELRADSDSGAAVADPAAETLVRELRELSATHARLLELHRELLSQYAELLQERAGQTATAALSAGPFGATHAVHEFERALAGLPGVTGVSVREYLSDDRVSFELTLGPG